MCGRFVTPAEAEIERAWGLTAVQATRNLKALFPELGERRYDVRPTTRAILLVNKASGEVETAHARWGFVPVWWNKDKPPTNTINARSEEAASKPMWRDAYKRSRCLVPARGWYEWREEPGLTPKTQKPTTIKQRYFMRRRDRQLIYLAGLVAERKDPVTGDPVLTYAILTRAAAGPVAAFHERMPVMFSKEIGEAWLDPAMKESAHVGQFIRDNAEEDFEVIPVASTGLTPTEDIDFAADPT
jgi:putative SOS response-associated peptidase YedK